MPSPASDVVPTPFVGDSRNPSPTPKTESVKSPVPSAAGQTSVAPSESPTVQQSGKPDGRPSRRALENDIGKSKKNGFYEITVESAWTSTNPVRAECSNVDIPTGQKVVFVRFAIMFVNFGSRSGYENFHLSSVKPSEFVLVDDLNRRVDPVCQNFPILVQEMANTKTLIYLVPMDSRRLTFRFQKVGAGEALTFDLSDLG
jgi:hypothetical protein